MVLQRLCHPCEPAGGSSGHHSLCQLGHPQVLEILAKNGTRFITLRSADGTVAGSLQTAAEQLLDSPQEAGTGANCSRVPFHRAGCAAGDTSPFHFESMHIYKPADAANCSGCLQTS